MLATLLALVIAYLIGSISMSALVIHYAQLPDLQSQGLGTLSSENVLLVAGREKALITIIADGLKGFLALLIAKILGVSGAMLGVALLAVVIGHLFSAYYHFRGGNGIAAAIGGLTLLSFWGSILLMIVWFVLTVKTRYVYLATLVVAALMPLIMLVFGHLSYVLPTLLIAALIIWRNFEHLTRLRAGTETHSF